MSQGRDASPQGWRERGTQPSSHVVSIFLFLFSPTREIEKHRSGVEEIPRGEPPVNKCFQLFQLFPITLVFSYFSSPSTPTNNDANYNRGDPLSQDFSTCASFNLSACFYLPLPFHVLAKDFSVTEREQEKVHYDFVFARSVIDLSAGTNVMGAAEKGCRTNVTWEGGTSPEQGLQGAPPHMPYTLMSGYRFISHSGFYKVSTSCGPATCIGLDWGTTTGGAIVRENIKCCL